MDVLFNFAIVILWFNILLVSGESAPQLLDKKSIGSFDSFTMTCNTSSFDGVNIDTPTKTVVWIGASRKLEGGGESMIAMYPPLLSYIPKGRDWEIKTRGGQGDFQTTLMELTLTVKDASCADIGEYFCKIRISESKKLILSTPFYLEPRLQLYPGDPAACGEFNYSSLGPEVIDKHVIGTGDVFTVTCDVSSFRGVVLLDKPFFMSMEIRRQVDNESEDTVALYQPHIPEHLIPVTQHIPEGRIWQITYDGGRGLENRETMRLSLKVMVASCSDAGSYVCRTRMHGTSRAFDSTPFRLYPKYNDTTIMNKIKVTPSHNETPESPSETPSNKSYNYIGENITMECTFTGAQNLKIKWAVSKGYDNLPNAIHYRPVLTKDYDGCPTYFHQSTYSFEMAASDVKSTYYCVAMNGTQEAGVAKMTFFTFDDISVTGILNKDTIGSNDTFIMTCNAASFADVELPLVNHFTFLAMARQLDDKDEDMFATYGPFDLPPEIKPFGHSIPDNRKWEFQYEGGEVESNKATISITLTVNDASCADAGLYKCMARIPPTTTLYRSKAFRLNAKFKRPTSLDNIRVTPANKVTSNTSYNRVGEIVTMDCTFRGISTIKSRWGSSRVSDYLSDAIDAEPTLIKDFDSCPTYFHKSVYTFIMTESDHRATYMCAVYNGNQEEAVVSMTFSMDMETATSVTSVNTAAKDGVKYDFTVTCDSSEFDGLVNENKTRVMGIGIVRQLPNKEDIIIAMYRPFAKEDEQMELNIPEGRQWSFNSSRGAGDISQAIINIEMTVNNATCEDVGPYQCAVKLAEIPNLIYSAVFYPKGNLPRDCTKEITAPSSNTDKPQEVVKEPEGLKPKTSAGLNYAIWFGLLSLIIVPIAIIMVKLGIRTYDDGML